jgi:DNA polymerase III delta prime subunit
VSSKNLYYNALFEDMRIANNMIGAVSDNLNKFERYLDIAIKTMRNKQQIMARWDKVDDPTLLKCQPLVYEIVVHSTVAIEVFMKERYLVLEVINDMEFDASEGIKLDHNFMPLLPDQFEVHPLNQNKHLISLVDPLLYKGEKLAYTSKGAIAQISELELSELTQNGRQVPILSKQYNRDKGSYRFVIDGEISEEVDLYVNGIYMDHQDWQIIDSHGTVAVLTDETGTVVPVKAAKGNSYYVDFTIPRPGTISINGIRTPFSIREIQVPSVIEHEGDSLIVEQSRGSYVTMGNTAFMKEGFLYHDSGLHIPVFRITPQEDRQHRARSGQLAIRLRDDSEDGEVFSKAPVDYFFDQDIEEIEGVINDKRITLSIRDAKPDERILFVSLKRGSQGDEPLRYRSIPEVLSIRVNTYQLEMQRKAIQRLKNQPLMEHLPLIRLSQKKGYQRIWPSFSSEPIERWYVLHDDTRQGVHAQREFVTKALATEDFALMEGPPGSGKTTTILELILQLVKRGKRILLCGSTHVSIDNVLERLKSENLLEGIFPLRIGSRESVSPDIKEFCLENYSNSKYIDLLVEAANLVCATTVGILRHPSIAGSNDQPAIPIYDYLIIDESSKTTFQEFLIPALFAKRWILVGDIKQLPPYSEREQLVAGLDDNAKLSPSLKKACLLIYQYLHNYRARMPVCIIESEEVIKDIQRELALAGQGTIKKGILIADRNPEPESSQYLAISELQLTTKHPVTWAINGADVLFVNEKLFDLIAAYIPNRMVVVKDQWENDSQHYQVNAYYSDHTKQLQEALRHTWKEDRYRDSKMPIDFLIEQKKFLKERSWAAEYEWRMVRIFELQNVDNSGAKENYATQLEQLAPKTASVQSMQDIDVIRDIALPSILQALQEGVGKNREGSQITTLNAGFQSEEKHERFVTLDFQHRMHPDISKFPRKQFYQDSALRNSTHTLMKREWAYSEYPARNVWLDVAGKMKGSSNDAEVSAMIRELRLFVAWAGSHLNENHSEGRWEVACLTFYNKQREQLARALQEFTGGQRNLSKFSIGNVDIKNYTVDKFQGQEADITFLSMVRTDRGMGFLDNPNRINVGITRARFQRVIIGKYHYFLTNKQSEQLSLLARESVYVTRK